MEVRTKRTIVVIAGVALLALSTTSYAGVVKGVLKLEDGTVLAKHAMTFVYNKKEIKATTDKNGKFSVFIPGAGTCDVNLTYGKEKLTKRIVSKQQTVSYEVVVSKNKSQRSNASKWILRAKDTSERPRG